MKENSIFSAAYWKAAVGELRQLKKLAIAALFCALCVVVGGFFIPLSQTIQIHFTFAIVAIGAAIYGPVMGMMVAALADVLNYFLFLSAYAYFPGYMLSEMLVALIFGLFLYRRKITVWRLFFSKLLVNFPVNVALGALWSRMLYGAAYIADFWARLIKNALLLPLEVIVLAALFALLIPVCARMQLLPAHAEKELRRLSAGTSVFPVMGLSCLVGGVCSIYYALGAEQAWVFWMLGGLLLASAAALPIIGKLLKKKKNAEG